MESPHFPSPSHPPTEVTTFAPAPRQGDILDVEIIESQTGNFTPGPSEQDKSKGAVLQAEIVDEARQAAEEASRAAQERAATAEDRQRQGSWLGSAAMNGLVETINGIAAREGMLPSAPVGGLIGSQRTTTPKPAAMKALPSAGEKSSESVTPEVQAKRDAARAVIEGALAKRQENRLDADAKGRQRLEKALKGAEAGDSRLLDDTVMLMEKVAAKRANAEAEGRYLSDFDIELQYGTAASKYRQRANRHAVRPNDVPAPKPSRIVQRHAMLQAIMNSDGRNTIPF